MLRTRIGFLINSFESGGAQRVFIDDANEFARQGASVVFCVLYGESGAYSFERELDAAVEKVFLRARSPFDLRAAARLRHMLRARGTRVLMSTLNDGNIFARWVALGSGIRLFQREANALSTKTSFQRALDLLFFWIPHRFLAVSNDIAAELARLLPFSKKKILLLPNSVVLSKLAPHPMNAVPRILLVGRLTEQKDYPTLLAALSELARRGQEFSCVCVGGGALRAELEQKAREEGIAERVTFTGEVPHEAVRKAYTDADVFVSASRWEGSPNALLEAMAYGLPPVATAVGGTKDILVDGVNGLLVPSGDAGALSAALARLLADKELRARLGAAARARIAETFSRESRFSRLQALVKRP